MKSERRALPKATPEMAKRVWARHQRPSARRVARAMGLAGYPVHWVTVARWRAHDWKAGPSDHPLEVARAQLEAVAPLITGDPETTLDDLIDDPDQRDIAQSSDDEVLRDAGREVAIATIVLSREISHRASLPETDLVSLTPILRALASSLHALPKAFEQALTLKSVKERPSFEAELCAADWAKPEA
jgi:hypothetical protein